jgi:hypothetical protein
VEDKRLCTAANRGWQQQQLVPFPARDDPLDLFRGLLFAVPASALGFWLPIAMLYMMRLHSS